MDCICVVIFKRRVCWKIRSNLFPSCRNFRELQKLENQLTLGSPYCQAWIRLTMQWQEVHRRSNLTPWVTECIHASCFHRDRRQWRPCWPTSRVYSRWHRTTPGRGTNRSTWRKVGTCKYILETPFTPPPSQTSIGHTILAWHIKPKLMHLTFC